ncbi:MAG: cytochrome c oxidase subunit II [Deltaproteobacteria bacterium]|nr:cytochrome c oxidase subunit II [Deltaproteobacteria bacterium]
MNESPYGYWLPIDISTHGYQIDQLIALLHWFMGGLFVFWSAFFIYCLIRFRHREGHQASYRLISGKFSKVLEVGVIIVESVLLIGFSIPIWASLKHDFPDAKEALTVHIVAEQFSWNIHYPGRDGVFGKRDVQLTSPSNPLGLDRKDPYGKDDITSINVFHMVVNKPVIVHLSSKDVIHSFFIPVMRIKQDAIPGSSIPIWFEATQTGKFDIACAQLCGLGHYRMRGEVSIDTQEAFDQWMLQKESESEQASSEETHQ